MTITVAPWAVIGNGVPYLHSDRSHWAWNDGPGMQRDAISLVRFSSSRLRCRTLLVRPVLSGVGQIGDFPVMGDQQDPNAI
jgi:hypothetical protein